MAWKERPRCPCEQPRPCKRCFPEAIAVCRLVVIFDFEDFFVISVLRKLNGVPTIDYHAQSIFLLDCLREFGGFSSNI